MSKNINYFINHLLFLYASIIVLFILLFSGCISKENKPSNITYDMDEDFMTQEKEIKITNVVSIGSLKPTGNLHINVGEIYTYSIYDNPIINARSLLPNSSNDVWCEPIRFDIFLDVEKTERINGSNYYVLQSERREIYPVCYHNVNGKIIKVTVGKAIYPNEKDNPFIYGGCRIGINKNNISAYPIPLGKNFGLCYETQIYEPWMLYLNESVSFAEKNYIEMDKNTLEENIETNVIGEEKINKFDCFKVQRIYALSSPNDMQKQIQAKDIIYVDKYKRIAVKYEHYVFAHGGYIPWEKFELKDAKILR
ncbi:MAG: hypothetical protein CVT88_00780 [Candidatus Altiarchaeales archaeon HGW-Altiarchaeales-1]|nr:MAG: hypothetical protein CVT88_00780 [Candidatus Altiarchaeales archaeon HGW-Altiarchaeales-1]